MIFLIIGTKNQLGNFHLIFKVLYFILPTSPLKIQISKKGF